MKNVQASVSFKIADSADVRRSNRAKFDEVSIRIIDEKLDRPVRTLLGWRNKRKSSVFDPACGGVTVVDEKRKIDL